MNASDFIVILLASGVFSSALAGIVTFLFKEWITQRLKNAIAHEYQQKLETHKVELKLEAQKAINQHQLVYKETLDALAGVYGRLAELQRRVGEYVSFWGNASGPEREASRQAVKSALIDFTDFLRPRRIFLSPQLLKMLEPISIQLQHMSTQFLFRVEKPAGDSRMDEASYDQWHEINEAMGRDIPPAMEKLENEFRRLLGTAF